MRFSERSQSPSSARAPQLDAIVAEWSNLTGGAARIRAQTVEVEEPYAHGDSLLLLALAIDRVASKESRVPGVVFGAVVQAGSIGGGSFPWRAGNGAVPMDADAQELDHLIKEKVT